MIENGIKSPGKFPAVTFGGDTVTAEGATACPETTSAIVPVESFPPVVVVTIRPDTVPTVIGSDPAEAWLDAWAEGSNVAGLSVIPAQVVVPAGPVAPVAPVGPAGPTPPETDAFTVWPLVETWTF